MYIKPLPSSSITPAYLSVYAIQNGSHTPWAKTVLLKRQITQVKCQRWQARKKAKRNPYNHSTVPGGLEVMSYVTRLMPATSFVMRDEMCRRTGPGKSNQSAVIKSSVWTARRAMTCSSAGRPGTLVRSTIVSTALRCGTYKSFYHP